MNKIIKISLYLQIFLLFPCLSTAQRIFNFQNSWDFFIEEKGQFKRRLKETYHQKINDKIYYGLENKDFNAYFTNKGIIFIYPERKNEFIETEKEREIEEKEEEELKQRVVIWHSIYFQFNNCNTPEIIATEKASNYFSYDEYNYDNKYFFHVPAYKKLVYKNIYSGIDVEFTLPLSGGIKYQYIVHPGSDIKQIKET